MGIQFYETHFVNVRNSIYCGLAIPGPKKAGALVWLYSTFLMAIELIMFVLFSVQIVQLNSLTRICVDFIGVCTLLYGLIIVIYLTKVIKPFKNLLEKFDEITFTCLNDPLDPKRTFQNRMLSDYKYIRMYSFIIVPFSCCSSIAFFALNIIRSTGIFGTDGKKIISVDLWFPNTDKSPNFEIAQVMSMFGIMISVSQKQAMDCLVLSLLALLCTYLDHLRMTINNVFVINSGSSLLINQTKSNDQICKDKGKFETNTLVMMFNENEPQFFDECLASNLKNWIKIHQKTLSLCRELIDLLAPLLAFYLVSIIALVAVNVFTVTLGEIAFMEFLCLTYYSIATGFSLYLFCNYGNRLLLKSTDVANSAFWSCFLLDEVVTKEVYQSLKIIFQRTMCPLVVSPFRSVSFELSHISFVSFAKSIISFYLAIKKIKEVISS